MQFMYELDIETRYHMVFLFLCLRSILQLGGAKKAFSQNKIPLYTSLCHLSLGFHYAASTFLI